MTITNFSIQEDIGSARRRGDPILAIISFDGERAYLGHIDECVEHHILLQKLGLPSGDIDKYFRIVFDDEGADWTFVCPADYRGIADKKKRVTAFYVDGFKAISALLGELGRLVDIKILGRV